jgi:hypothetical protein
MTGDRCEKERPLEFGVRWERNPETNELEIAQSTMMVAPAYEFKRRTTENNDEFLSLPDMLIGELGPTKLEAGDFSATYAPPALRQLINSGRVKVEPLPLADQTNPNLLKFKITTRTRNGERVEIKTVNVNASAVLNIRDPDTGANLGATLMPYAVHFQPRSTPYFQSERWQPADATGTALHGADWEHITCRWSGNIASATYRRMADRIQSHGGAVGAGGMMLELDSTELRDPATGRLTGTRMVESQQNAANIDAMLGLRKETQIKAFMPASLNALSAHYQAKATEAWSMLYEQLDTGTDLGEFGDRLYWRREAFRREATKREELSRLQANIPQSNFFNRRTNTLNRIAQLNSEIVELQQYNVAGATAFLERMNQVAKEQGREALPGAMQNFYVLIKKNNGLKEQIAAAGANADRAAYEPSGDENSMYYQKKNYAMLWDSLADSIERYYDNRFGDRVPAACKAFVRKYRKQAADIRSGAVEAAPRARAVQSDVPVLRALPVE